MRETFCGSSAAARRFSTVSAPSPISVFRHQALLWSCLLGVHTESSHLVHTETPGCTDYTYRLVLYFYELPAPKGSAPVDTQLDLFVVQIAVRVEAERGVALKLAGIYRSPFALPGRPKAQEEPADSHSNSFGLHFAGYRLLVEREYLRKEGVRPGSDNLPGTGFGFLEPARRDRNWQFFRQICDFEPF